MITGSNEKIPQYGEIPYPPQSNEAFHVLLGEAQQHGFLYKVPDNPDLLPRADSEEEEMAYPPPSPSWSAETPPPPIAAVSGAPAMLLVNVRVKPGLYKHAVLRTREPISALEAYEFVMQSTERAVSSIVSILVTIDDEDVMLATSRKPIPMDERRKYQDVMSGYTELGRLSDLDRSAELKPVVVCEEQGTLAIVHDIPDCVRIFVLYIWSDVSDVACIPVRSRLPALNGRGPTRTCRRL